MKKLLFILLLFPLMLKAQNNIVSGGSKATGTNGSFTSTIGQVFYKTLNGTNGTVSQGVHQVFEILTLGTTEIPEIQLIASVYPNPAFQNITLSIKEYDLSNLSYKLYDIQGKIIESNKITQNETQIEITSLASAHYFLKINQNASNLKTFKIIKK
jgi:hypothetical protein